ncbi:MAG TPA: hypothetical protein VFC82_02825 [Actinomycetaceae bacterium]|nr:hypothetical protein [Actinomycetaceae bacterium]
MPRDFDPYAMSELESEFEFEFEMDGPPDRGGGAGLEAEFEAFFEAEAEAEADAGEPLGEYEYENGPGYENGRGFEHEQDYELEIDDDRAQEFAERFFELSQREFESEAEAENAIDGLLTEMEPEYFFGAIKKAYKKAKKTVRSVARSPIGGLIKKGITAAGGKLPVFQALKGVTALARGNTRNFLKQLAASGVNAAIPGAGAFMPTAMKAMGFEAGVDPEENREAWDNFVALSREAYGNLANNLTERADEPLEASRIAHISLQQALQNAPRTAGTRDRAGASPSSKRRVVTVRPGDEIIIRVRRD